MAAQIGKHTFKPRSGPARNQTRMLDRNKIMDHRGNTCARLGHSRQAVLGKITLPDIQIYGFGRLAFAQKSRQKLRQCTANFQRPQASFGAVPLISGFSEQT